MIHSDPPADPPAPTAAANPPDTAPPEPAATAELPSSPDAVESPVATEAPPPESVEPAAAPRPKPTAPYAPLPRVQRCENCGTPLLGEHCYACGQPTKGLIRQFGSIAGDFLDTVFNIDSRVLRSIGPLLLHPGRLTLEYFEGHRIRYVSPVRLFVFLSLMAFLAAQWSLNINGDGPGIQIEGDNTGSIDAARTPEAVIKARDRALAGIEQGKRQGTKVPGLVAGLDAAEKEVRADADARLKELAAEAAANGKAPPAKPPLVFGPGVPPGATPGEGPPPRTDGGLVVDPDDGNLRFNGRIWDPKSNPVAVGWLPAAANAQLNTWIGRAKGNIERLQKDKDKNWIKDAFLGVVPTILILLLPLFALLLKVMYLFKRRLYMEHLVVALHSHAFLCLVLLLQSLVSLLEGAIAAPSGALATMFGWIEGALWAWAPIYVLLMQKRIYGQGWILTVAKFGVIGVAYCFMVLFGGLAAAVVTLVRT
jgi:hypothetical protein